MLELKHRAECNWVELNNHITKHFNSLSEILDVLDGQWDKGNRDMIYREYCEYKKRQLKSMDLERLIEYGESLFGELFNKKIKDIIRDSNENNKEETINKIRDTFIPLLAKLSNKISPEGEDYFFEKGLDGLQKALYFKHNRNIFVFDFLHMHLLDPNSRVCHLIADSIFCLWEATRMLKNYEVNYITNYSFYANGYIKLGNWVELYHKCLWVKKHLPDGLTIPNDPEIMLHDLIGQDAAQSIDQYLFYELGIQALTNSIQMHRQGKIYRDVNATMHFLNDDYNDNLTHFSAATERFRINNGSIRRTLDNIIAAMKKSWVYDYDNYWPQEKKGNTASPSTSVGGVPGNN